MRHNQPRTCRLCKQKIKRFKKNLSHLYRCVIRNTNNARKTNDKSTDSANVVRWPNGSYHIASTFNPEGRRRRNSIHKKWDTNRLEGEPFVCALLVRGCQITANGRGCSLVLSQLCLFSSHQTPLQKSTNRPLQPAIRLATDKHKAHSKGRTQ